MRPHKLSQVQSIAIVMMMSFKDSRMKLKSFAEVFEPITKDNSKHDQISYHKILKGRDGAIRDMIVREDDKINE